MKKHIKFYLLLVVIILPISTIKAENKIALVIGVNQYLHLSNLKAAVNDAHLMKNHLKSNGYEVFYLSDEEKSITRRPEKTTLKNVMRQIENISASEGIDKFVFYFSGHGVSISGASYLAFSSAKVNKRQGMVNLDAKLIPWMRRLKAGQSMVFIDACRERISNSRSSRLKGIKFIKKAKSKNQGIFIMYAASPGGYSIEQANGRNGYFTKQLLKGFRINHGKSMREMSRWLRQSLPKITLSETGYEQVPFVGGDYDPNAKFKINKDQPKIAKSQSSSKSRTVESYRARKSYGAMIGYSLLWPGAGLIYANQNRGYYYSGVTFAAAFVLFFVASNVGAKRQEAELAESTAEFWRNSSTQTLLAESEADLASANAELDSAIALRTANIVFIGTIYALSLLDVLTTGQLYTIRRKLFNRKMSVRWLGKRTTFKYAYRF